MKNKISVCKDDLCLHANGEYADVITAAATFTLVCIGIAALVKAL